MLLRVFFLSQVDPEEARAYLRRRVEYVSKQLEYLEGIKPFVESGHDNLSVYGRLALEYGLRLGRVQREWAEWAESQIH